MMTCASCSDQLFDYVYGLLDETADAAALTELRSHLATCTSCQAAYEKALSQQKLIGEASRQPTTITFVAPKVETRSLRFRQQSSSLTWYVTAATVLFALLGIMGSTYWWGYASTWKPREEARLELERINQSPALDSTQLTTLQQQLSDTQAKASQLKQSLAQLEERTQKTMLAQATFQQVIAPTSVPNTSDTPLVVNSSTLAGAPAPMPEMGLHFKDTASNYSLQQQNRGQQIASAKSNLFLPSIAYSDSAGKLFSNEVVQDISNSALGIKVTHPLHVLHTDYLAHLVTDKPLYQPGEELFFRGIALDKTNLTVPREDLEFRFKVTGPEGKDYFQVSRVAQAVDSKSLQPIRDQDGKPLKGIGAGVFKLPSDMPSGEVTVTLSEKNNRFPEQATRVMVNPVTPPRFDKSLQFHRPSYAPGDEVILNGVVRLPNQQPLVHTGFTAQIEIDGQLFDLKGNATQIKQTSSTDATGNVKLAFLLPKTMKQGRGTLALQFATAEGIDTWSQPIRIETGQVQVECFPEGGDLIAGFPNDVYFQMRNTAGEAIDGEAELIDGQGNIIAKLATFFDESEAKASRGMGKFSFTPQANQSYQVRMRKPASGQSVATMPAARTSGVGLHVKQPVLPAGAPLILEISNVGKPRDLVIAVYCRQALIALDRISLASPITQTTIIDTIKPLGGVYRVTVAEFTSQDQQAQFIPLSERLIYRQPAQTLQLKMKAQPVTGSKVELQLDATNESKQPSPAFVTIVGVNKSLLQLAEGATQRRLPAHFLIANEVRQPEELEYADFFLSSHHSAAQALDLLLGVQGWRRFKESSLEFSQFRDQKQLEVEKQVPLKLYDNRSQVLEQVTARVRAAVAQSKEASELNDAQARIKILETGLQDASRQFQVTENAQAEKLTRVRNVLDSRSNQWQTFSLWFHVLSAGTLGLMSLAGLIAMLMKRSLLPTHLICTIGALSLLGLLGAGWLWMQQSAPLTSVNTTDNRLPQATMVNQATVQEPALLPPPAAVASGVGKSEGKAWADHPESKESVRQAPLNKPKDPGKQEQLTSKSEKANTNIPASPKKEFVDSKTKALPTGGDTSPVSNASDSIRMRASNNYNQGNYNRRNYDANDNSRRLLENQRASQLANSRPLDRESEQEMSKDNLSRDKEAPALRTKTQIMEHTSNQSESVKKQAPGAPSAGGGFGGGSLGGKAGSTANNAGAGRASPPASLESKNVHLDTRGAESLSTGKGTAKSVENSNAGDQTKPIVFYVREFSWNEQSRPTGLTANSAWSKTIYWNPLAVIPSTGKLTIPLELPPFDGSYQFEVYGHDGQGRLGSSVLEIKSAPALPKPTPIALSTRLSRTEAKVGEVVQLDCLIENQTPRRQPNIIVKLHIPEGLKLPENLKQLRQTIRSTTASDYVEPTRWFVQNRELTLIWSELPSEKKVTLSVDLYCNKAGEYQASQSRAYLENQERDATIIPGLRITIRQ
ncbi:MAG: hypothetical protein U0796_23235 [Gemmatales bacterium]